MRKSAALLTTLALAFSALASASITITPSIKNGQTVAGEMKVSLVVDSDSLVTSVEFYVGDDLIGTDNSTPYEFSYDTLSVDDGSLKMALAAYNEKGESAKATVTVSVNNEISKGTVYLAGQSNSASDVSNWIDGVRFGRAAVKADATSVTAKLALARAYFGAGQFDRAQQHAEDAGKIEPTNRRVLDLLSAIHLKRAFSTLDRGDRAETANVIRGAFAAAAKSRTDSLQAVADGFVTVDDSNRIAYVDALLDAGRYSLVISELKPRFRTNPKDNQIADRLMFAQVRSGRLQEAAQTMKDVQRFGEFDGEGEALRALLLLFAGEYEASAEAEKNALLNSPDSLVVASCRTWMSLRRNDLGAARSLATGLAATQGQDPIVNSALCTLYWRTGEFEKSRAAFETAILAEPANVDLYIEKANQVIEFGLRSDVTGEDRTYQFRLADAYFDAALAAKPDSFQAMTGKSLTLAMLKDTAGALKFATSASKAGPNYAGAQYALAAVLFDLNQNTEAKNALKAAEVADARGLGGRPIPKVLDAWQYFAGIGRLPLVARPRG
ncbi:MAG: tetratricopeptide repeat protein [Fimbriimonadaceae bacterium]